MGAGGAIYAPQNFLNRSNPSIILKNVSINNCSAIGGNGGSYLGSSSTGSEGGGGGGGLGSRATIGTPMNLGNGGSDQANGLDGNGYGLALTRHCTLNEDTK